MTMISPLGVTSACQFSFWIIKGIITNKGLFKYASRPNIISFTHLHKHTHTHTTIAAAKQRNGANNNNDDETLSVIYTLAF